MIGTGSSPKFASGSRAVRVCLFAASSALAEAEKDPGWILMALLDVGAEGCPTMEGLTTLNRSQQEENKSGLGSGLPGCIRNGHKSHSD